MHRFITAKPCLNKISIPNEMCPHQSHVIQHIGSGRGARQKLTSSQLIHFLKMEPPPQKMDLLCHDWKAPDVSSTNYCLSDDLPWPGGIKDPHIVTDANEDITDVNVKIPEFHIRKFEEMPVVISHIVNPDKFFIQHEDTTLLEISKIFCRVGSSRKSFLQMNRIPDIGLYVMAWFSEQKLWCRAQVCKIRETCRATSQKDFTNVEVEVRRIDYGDIACITLGNIKELLGEIASTPVQTLEVSLANVRPINGENWSFEAISWFKSKVKNLTLYARVYPERGRVCVELFLEKGKIGAMRRGDSLSMKLAQHGYGKHEHEGVRLLRSHVQHKTGQQSLAWEKYLLSCYSQSKK